MKRFLTTTALVLALTGTATAQTAQIGLSEVQIQPNDFYASDLIGMRIYNAETPIEANTKIADGGETEWEDIGEINDIIVTSDGKLGAVILGVGGFLGVGERDIAVPMSSIMIVREEGDSDDRFLVVSATKEALEAVPAVERAPRNDAAMPAVTAPAGTEATRTETGISDRAMLTRPTVTRDGYAEIEITALTERSIEKLEGATIYGANDENVGEIDRLIVGDDGAIKEAVVNVGGFLGLAEKPVAVTFDELQILAKPGEDDYRIYIDSTKETLEALPEYGAK